MDERKRNIEDLQKKKREGEDLLNLLIEELGEHFFQGSEPRPGDEGGESFSAYRQEYQRHREDIAGAESCIKDVEAELLRLKGLEETIEMRERENSEDAKELAAVYGKLGRLLLNDPSSTGFSPSFREQADVLISKIQSLDGRLGELSEKEGNNVFTWIGKSAQGVVLRSFLAKAEDNLERLYRSTGEQFCTSRRSGESGEPVNNEAASLLGDIEKNREISLGRVSELSKLREESRKINAGFGPDGGPAKKIQSLRNRIDKEKTELKSLYRRLGNDLVSAAGIDARGETAADSGAAAFSGEDRELFERIRTLRQNTGGLDREIEKLKALLIIDEENETIEKLHRAIEERRKRIEAAEKDIILFEGQIKEAEEHIEVLKKSFLGESWQ